MYIFLSLFFIFSFAHASSSDECILHKDKYFSSLEDLRKHIQDNYGDFDRNIGNGLFHQIFLHDACDMPNEAHEQEQWAYLKILYTCLQTGNLKDGDIWASDSERIKNKINSYKTKQIIKNNPQLQEHHQDEKTTQSCCIL